MFLTDKRNSTGNLYFTDSLQDPMVGLSNSLQKGSHHHGSQPVRTDNSSCTGSVTSIESTATLGSSTTGMAMSVSKELRTAAGNCNACHHPNIIVSTHTYLGSKDKLCHCLALGL